MKAGSSQLPCVSLLHRSSLAGFSPSACVCPAGRHTFQTGESLFLGSLGFLTPPLVLYLTLYGSSFFLQKGNKFPVCMRVCVVYVCTWACIVCQRVGEAVTYSARMEKKSLLISLRKLAFYFRVPPRG